MSLKSERFELLIDLLKSDVRLSLFPFSRFNLSLRRRKYHWPARRAAIPIKDPSCCAQSSRQYSVRYTWMKRVCPSLVRWSKNTEGKRLKRKRHTRPYVAWNARRTRWTRWEKPTLTPVLMKWRCICSNVLQSFQDLADVVTAIKTHRSVKVMMNPACVATLWLEMSPNVPSPAAMISTFVTKISTMTIHVLHGEPQPSLGTCKR